MTRKYKVERTHFIGCQNISYMDVSDAKPCTFCGGVEVTIYPHNCGVSSYEENVRTVYYSDATCRCLNCGAEIDGPKRGSIIEGEDLFRLPPDIAHADVIDSSRDHIKVLDHQDAYVIVPCTCLDIK